MPKVSVLVPAKNEARNIGWVLERIPVWVDEVVLVDGRSQDRTIEVARAIRPDIVVVQDEKPGKGAAVRAGLSAATGQFVVMLDADGSMDPREIEAFVTLLYDGHDLVKGSRFAPGGGTADMSVLRSAGNRALLILANILFGVAHTDLCYGFAAFRRDRVLALDLDAIGFEIETQLFLRATRQGLRVTEAPSFEAPRRFGTSNLNTFRDGWRVLKTIVAERLRPVSPAMEALRIESDTVAIPIEPGIRQVASIVTDAYALAGRTVPASVENFVE
jgi:glycosyltransferase involved in cell wall biosynthesis